MRRGTLVPTTQANQAVIPRLTTLLHPSGFPRSRGKCPKDKGGAKLTRRERSVQGSGERITYPADVYPLRRAGEATALARGKNLAMAGAFSSTLPEGPTVWRRRGRWKPKRKRNYKKPIARDPTDAAMFRDQLLPARGGNAARRGARIPRLNAPKTTQHPYPSCPSMQVPSIHASQPRDSSFR